MLPNVSKFNPASWLTSLHNRPCFQIPLAIFTTRKNLNMPSVGGDVKQSVPCDKMQVRIIILIISGLVSKCCTMLYSPLQLLSSESKQVGQSKNTLFASPILAWKTNAN